jgi:hypothetical protein
MMKRDPDRYTASPAVFRMGESGELAIDPIGIDTISTAVWGTV